MEQKEEKIYRPRQPQHTPLYQIFNNYYDKFKDEYEEKYQKKYGFFRNVIDTTVEKYLKCGIPKYGFAGVKCINCKNEFLLPFLP